MGRRWPTGRVKSGKQGRAAVPERVGGGGETAGVRRAAGWSAAHRTSVCSVWSRVNLKRETTAIWSALARMAGPKWP